MTKEQVIKIQKIIDDNKTKKIQTETKLEAEYKYAKDNYDCNSIKEIEAKLDVMDEEITSIEKAIEVKSKELEEAYNWQI